MRTVALAAVLACALTGPALAQYGAPGGYSPAPPPSGFNPDRFPPQGSEGYPPPQPEGGLPPRAGEYGYGRSPYGPPGGRCDAVFDTRNGPRRRVCPMGVAKPVGAPCSCPPRNPYGPTAEGRVVP